MSRERHVMTRARDAVDYARASARAGKPEAVRRFYLAAVRRLLEWVAS